MHTTGDHYNSEVDEKDEHKVEQNHIIRGFFNSYYMYNERNSSRLSKNGQACVRRKTITANLSTLIGIIMRKIFILLKITVSE